MVADMKNTLPQSTLVQSIQLYRGSVTCGIAMMALEIPRIMFTIIHIDTLMYVVHILSCCMY
jgi:hypothetical protein